MQIRRGRAALENSATPASRSLLNSRYNSVQARHPLDLLLVAAAPDMSVVCRENLASLGHLFVVLSVFENSHLGWLGAERGAALIAERRL